MSIEAKVWIGIGILAVLCFVLMKLRGPGPLVVPGSVAIAALLLALAAGTTAFTLVPSDRLIPPDRAPGFAGGAASFFAFMNAILIGDLLGRPGRRQT